MLSSTRQFTDAMDNKGIKYEYKGTTDSGKDIVVLGYTCEIHLHPDAALLLR